MNVIFGVEIKVICFGDIFHIDNLTVTHTSIKIFRDTEQDNHLHIIAPWWEMKRKVQ